MYIELLIAKLRDIASWGGTALVTGTYIQHDMYSNYCHQTYL